jgi:hypothetical protein
MWIRESVVTVGPGSFPDCIETQLKQFGLTPVAKADTDGSQRLVAGFFSGALNVTAKEESVQTSQVITLKVVGRGFAPPKQFEHTVPEELGRLSSEIAKSCSN